MQEPLLDLGEPSQVQLHVKSLSLTPYARGLVALVCFISFFDVGAIMSSSDPVISTCSMHLRGDTGCGAGSQQKRRCQWSNYWQVCCNFIAISFAGMIMQGTARNLGGAPAISDTLEKHLRGVHENHAVCIRSAFPALILFDIPAR